MPVTLGQECAGVVRQVGDELHRAFEIVEPGGRIVSLAGDPDPAVADKMGLVWIKKQRVRSQWVR